MSRGTERRLSKAERAAGGAGPDPYADLDCRQTITISWDPEEGGESWECWRVSTGEPVEATADIRRALKARWDAEPGPRRYTLEPVLVHGPKGAGKAGKVEVEW